MKLISDSTCNLAPEVIEKYKISIAPIAIQFGNDTYLEEIDIDRDAFYAKIEELQIIPTSSQPSPATFAQLYQDAADSGEQVLVVTVTQKHSGTFDSAILAQSMVPEADVVVFDSKSISLGTGWLVLEAARMDSKGASREEVLARLTRIRSQAKLYLTPAVLKYLQMSGRVGRLQGALASLLSLKPIITLRDGELSAEENVRTRGKALERLLSMAEEAVGTEAPIHAAVIHARAEEEGQTLLEQVQKRFNVKDYLMEDLVSSLAVHGGPGVIGLVVYPA